MFQLKPLSPSALPAALAKAERYRLLNEPEQAESICEDILASQPENRDAQIVLLLALTDRFPHCDGRLVSRAQAIVARVSRLLGATELTHVPVMETSEVGEQRLRGLLSGAKVRRLLSR